MKVKQIIEAWLVATHSQDSTAKFSKWLSGSRNAEQKDAVLFEKWQEASEEYSKDSLERSFAAIQSKIQSAGDARPKQVRHWLSAAWRVAAAAVIIPLLSLGIAQLYLNHNMQPDVELLECSVPYGQLRTVVLPDGSEVVLNAGSTLVYPSRFTKSRREVYVIGEANFTVQHDSLCPFVVKTKSIDVKVLGTVFNINAYAENRYITTTLKSGLVEVQANSSRERVVLSPGEQALYDQQSQALIKQKANVEQEFAWDEGGLYFKGHSIRDIIDVLERRYNVKIYLNSNKLDGALITAKFTNQESIEDVLNVLQHLLSNMKWQQKENTFYIN